MVRWSEYDEPTPARWVLSVEVASEMSTLLRGAMGVLARAGHFEPASAVAITAAEVMRGAGSPLARFFDQEASSLEAQEAELGRVFDAAVDVSQLVPPPDDAA